MPLYRILREKRKASNISGKMTICNRRLTDFKPPFGGAQPRKKLFSIQRMAASRRQDQPYQ